MKKLRTEVYFEEPEMEALKKVEREDGLAEAQKEIAELNSRVQTSVVGDAKLDKIVRIIQ